MLFDEQIGDGCLLISATPYPDGTKYYQDDIDTFEKLLNILKNSGDYGCRFTLEGYGFLIKKYTPREILEITNYYLWLKTEETKSLSDLRVALEADLDRTMLDNKIIDKDDAINILKMSNIFDYNNMNLLLSDGQIVLDYQNLHEILTWSKDRISDMDTEETKIKDWIDAFFYNKYNLIYDYYNICEYGYVNLYLDFVSLYKSKDFKEKIDRAGLAFLINECLFLLKKYEEEKEKPLYSRTLSDAFKEQYLVFYRDKLNLLSKRDVSKIKTTYMNFLIELRDKKNIVGFESTVYTYYGSNKLMVNDYSLCERELDLLVNNYGLYRWCGAYGDIFFFGKNERRRKDYSKAYNIYLMGALNNDLYCNMRVYDCIYHGYGGFINPKFAAKKMKELYQYVLSNLSKERNYALLALISYHLGEYESDRVESIEKAFEYYLTAYCAINYALNFNLSFNRQVLKEKIEQRLKMLYKNNPIELIDIDKNEMLIMLFNNINSYQIDKINLSNNGLTIKVVTTFPKLFIDVMGKNADVCREITLSFKSKDYVLNKDVGYYSVEIKDNCIYFIPDSDYYKDRVIINIESSTHEEIEEDKKISDFYICFSDFSAYLENDEIRDYLNFCMKKNTPRKYLCASCTYKKVKEGEENEAKHYTFIALNNNLKEAHVVENGVVVYPHDYFVLEEDELPVPYDEMKHIAI